jgi:hypothetical protein
MKATETEETKERNEGMKEDHRKEEISERKEERK